MTEKFNDQPDPENNAGSTRSKPKDPKKQTALNYEKGGMVDCAINELNAELIDTQEIPEEPTH